MTTGATPGSDDLRSAPEIAEWGGAVVADQHQVHGRRQAGVAVMVRTWLPESLVTERCRSMYRGVTPWRLMAARRATASLWSMSIWGGHEAVGVACDRLAGVPLLGLLVGRQPPLASWRGRSAGEGSRPHRRRRDHDHGLEDEPDTALVSGRERSRPFDPWT